MSHSITIKDKQFIPFIKHEDIVVRVKKMAELINEIHKSEFPLFLVILNGAFMFASDLLKEIKMPCEISFVKVASYNGTQTTANLKELIGLNENVAGRQVIIVEDIVDTGHTIESIQQSLRQKNVGNVKVATALLKPNTYKREMKIDYVGFEIPDNFVVGYGLDYDGLGRNLKDIHVLV